MWSKAHSFPVTNKTIRNAIIIQTFVFESNLARFQSSIRHVKSRSKRQRSIDLNFKQNKLMTNKPCRVIVVQFQNFSNTLAYADDIRCSQKLSWKVMDLHPESIKLQFYFTYNSGDQGWSSNIEPLTFHGPCLIMLLK